MSISSSLTSPSAPQQGDVPRYAAGWVLLLALFISAASWLLLGSVFGLISSIKFHSPGFLADPAWLTYGRVRAAAVNLLLYGFCLQGGLGAALWILMRTGRTAIILPLMAALGACVLNVGVLAGLGGILAGHISGFEGFEMPGYAAVFILAGYMLVGVSVVLTLRARQNDRLSVPQWFLLAAVFWFPWIYSTASLLLLFLPVRGVAQSVIAWWYTANFQLVWLGLVGLASAFYLLPRILGRELNSRNLALFCFWTLVLFGSWTGVPRSAPVPAWIPAWSVAATVITSVFYIGVLLTSRATTFGQCRLAWGEAGRFSSFGLSALLFFGLLTVGLTAIGKNEWLNFTWINAARFHLLAYGFFSMIIFGCIFTAASDFFASPLPRIARAQFWLAAIGTVLLSLPLAGAGIVQALKLRNPDIAFVDVTKATLHFLRLSTIGDLLLVVANAMLLFYLVSVAIGAFRERGRKLYQTATAEVVR
jgi:cytochrome c oxidase cbb3-type subunit 1